MKRIDLMRTWTCAILFSFALTIAPAALRAADDTPAPEVPPKQEIMIPMRDGVKLATDVYFPTGEGPWPLVLARTPYNKGGRSNRLGYL